MTLRLTLAFVVLALLAPCAQAGTATVAVQDDTVTVEGDETADVLTVTRSDQGLVVTPGAGTETDAAPTSGCVRDPMSQAVTCPGTEQAILRGNGGADQLTGGPGDDVLDGGAGADDLRGGDGV